jgi:hypothetical protein
LNERRRLTIGYLAILLGIVTTLVVSVAVHMASAPDVDEFGQTLYSFMPRGWIVVTILQSIAVGGTVLAIAGATFGFIYQRPMTWARAMFAALLFTGFMFILFAIIPNQFLTLAQSQWEWTPQKTFLTIPPILVLNNNVAISYAALKDMISAGYVTTLIVVIPVVMYQWQERAKRVDTPKPTPISDYGRPLRTDR